METNENENVYVGDGLTKICQREGCDRINGENDWSLRKRTFLKSFKNNPFLAMEILFGTKKEFFTEADEVMHACLFVGVKNPINITDEELKKYVNGLRTDPLSLREGKKIFSKEIITEAVDYKTLSKEAFKERIKEIIACSFSKKQIREKIHNELLYKHPFSIFYGTIPQTNSIESATGIKVSISVLSHPGGYVSIGW